MSEQRPNRESISIEEATLQPVGNCHKCGGAMRYVVMAILMALTGFDLSMAQTRDQQRESLRGLQGVEVVIEDIKSDAQVDGLSQEVIRAAVETSISVDPHPSLFATQAPY